MENNEMEDKLMAGEDVYLLKEGEDSTLSLAFWYPQTKQEVLNILPHEQRYKTDKNFRIYKLTQITVDEVKRTKTESIDNLKQIIRRNFELTLEKIANDVKEDTCKNQTQHQ